MKDAFKFWNPGQSGKYGGLITGVIIAALLALVRCSASGELGETPSQFETGKPAQVSADQDGTIMVWKGQKIAHLGYFQNGVATEEGFTFNNGHRPVAEDMNKWMEPYTRKGWLIHKIDEPEYDDAITATVTDASGKDAGKIILVKMPSGWLFLVVTMDRWSVFKANLHDKTSAQPSAQPNAKDCVAVAVENMVRLKAGVYQERIFAFQYSTAGATGDFKGHAMVAFKLSKNGPVYLIDQPQGTIGLDTRVFEPGAIARAFEAKAQKYGTDLKIQQERFLE